MKTRDTLTVLVSLALMMGSALAGMAQKYVSDGFGKFDTGRDSRKVSKSEIKFTDDGRFVCSIEMEDHSRVQIKGEYRGNGPRRSITVTEGLGRRGTHGSGSILLSDNKETLREINITGKVERDNFNLSFKTRDREEHRTDPTPAFAFTFNQDARGRYDLGNNKQPIAHFTVKMARKDGFRILVSGPGMEETTWDGVWSGNGDVLQVDLVRHGDARVKATGLIKLVDHRSKVQQLDVKGVEAGRAFHLFVEAR